MTLTFGSTINLVLFNDLLSFGVCIWVGLWHSKVGKIARSAVKTLRRVYSTGEKMDATGTARVSTFGPDQAGHTKSKGRGRAASKCTLCIQKKRLFKYK